MKRLIAKRPIQYMGRTYDCGETLPAHDGRMVDAWLGAATAEWSETERAAVAGAALESAKEAGNNDKAADALRAMGVAVEDDAGAFVGEERLAEQIRAVFAQERPQEGADGQGGQEPAGSANAAQEGGQSAAGPKMVTGHLDAAELAKMKKPELEKLAADMNVNISTAKNNEERAALIAAVPVQAPADESGGAQ